MTGLTEKAAGPQLDPEESIAAAHAAWEQSMLRRIGELVEQLEPRSPEELAGLCGGQVRDGQLQLDYWGERIALRWPELEAHEVGRGKACSTFDRAIALYYLASADGAPVAGRWIGFRELPEGAFYHQAFQGYSGNRLVQHFGADQGAFADACERVDGQPLSEFGSAFSFRPFARIFLAAVLWPGDDQLPSRASILFDAAASHYMPTDGLAILGSGLASRLIRADTS